MDPSNRDEVPSELVDSFTAFSSTIDEMETAMKPLHDTPRNEMIKKCTPLEMAKLDLVCAYAINSLFWMHLITHGINPRSHDIKGELDRIKSYMSKVREIEDRKNAPKLKKDAAKRFVRNAMFDVESKNQQKMDKESQRNLPAFADKPGNDDKETPEVKTEEHENQCDKANSSTTSVPTGSKRKRKKTDKPRKSSKKAHSKN